MAINSQDVEKIVKSVLANIGQGTAPAADKGMAQVAMLTAARKFDVVDIPIPEVDDDEILVKVEGCGVCGTDVHEWKGDPFGLIPVVLGHEGTGEVVALGKNVKTDTQGKPISVGDKIVTSVLTCGTCPMCIHHPEQSNLCDNQGIYGLITDSGKRLNGWFSSHLLIRKNSTFFVVNELTLDQRMLLELAAVAVHALERAKSTGVMKFDSKVLVQGCGPVGLMMIAVIKAFGIFNVIALDGDDKRLEMAMELGAKKAINFKKVNSLDERLSIIKEGNDLGADFAFQCTGVPAAAAEVWKYVRRGGGLCEMGFFVNNGDATINPHFDICNKEITLVGSWDYGAECYPTTIAFMKRAKECGIPVEKLITHRFPLNKMNEAMEVNISQQGIKIAYVNDK